MEVGHPPSLFAYGTPSTVRSTRDPHDHAHHDDPRIAPRSPLLLYPQHIFHRQYRSAQSFIECGTRGPEVHPYASLTCDVLSRDGRVVLIRHQASNGGAWSAERGQFTSKEQTVGESNAFLHKVRRGRELQATLSLDDRRQRRRSKNKREIRSIHQGRKETRAHL